MKTGKPIAALYLAAALAWLGLDDAEARVISIRIEPTTAKIDSLTVEISNGSSFSLVPAADGSYSVDEPVGANPSVPVYYVVVGSWTDSNHQSVSSQFYMKAPASADPKLTILAIHPPATQSFLVRIENEGDTCNAVLKRYQLARDIFRQTVDIDNDVNHRALDDWFQAALVLATTCNSFAGDPEAARHAGAAGNSHTRAMAPQLSVAKWKDAAQIASAYAAGRYADAAALNDHFKAEFDALPASDQSAVTKYYHINASLLESNTQAISNKLVSAAQKNLAQ